MRVFEFHTRFARRIPDPVFDGLQRHIFVVPIRNLPAQLPTDPNARAQSTRTRVARKIKESLLDVDCDPGTFHLKNNGITLIAESVRRQSSSEDLFEVEISDGQGIIDGAHTHKIIIDSIGDLGLPKKQYVTVEILTGIKREWIPEISGGRNTTVQVKDMSLDNLGGKFDWMKDELRNEHYFNDIAWRENDPGEYDARDLISFLSMFNIDLYPNDGEDHPTNAYSGKAKMLKRFERKPASFISMQPILKDILRLHDTIRREYRPIWNDQRAKTRAGGLAISEEKPTGKWRFVFTNECAKYRMLNSALCPILAAFRWYVRKDPDTGRVYWNDGFEDVLDAWRSCAIALLKATNEMYRELRRQPNALGKSITHWRSLHQLVAMRDLQRNQG